MEYDQSEELLEQMLEINKSLAKIALELEKINSKGIAVLQ
jgi:hypothetical protein